MRTIPPVSLFILALAPLAVMACADGANESDGAIIDDEVLIGVDTNTPTGCFITGCEDGDPCTDDFCIENGARCIHVARNAIEACQTDFHCDDDNPCTIDKCGTDVECNLQRCTHEFIEGCRACRSSQTGGALPPDFNECDDGNPCTDEVCGDDLVCHTSQPDRACDPRCVSTQALPLDAVQYNYVYDGQSVIGQAAPSLGLFCEGGACACDADLALKGDSGWGFPVRASAAEPGPLMCDVEVCDTPGASCTPLVAGATYVVWGHFVTATRFAAPAPPPEDAGAQADVALPPTVTALEVEGYCLSTQVEHAAGDYEGELVVGAAIANFELTIAGGRGAIRDCVGCEAVGLAPTATFSFESSFSSGALLARGVRAGVAVTASLRPRKSTLTGPLLDSAQQEIGSLAITRVR
jgi:hypothetical protein